MDVASNKTVINESYRGSSQHTLRKHVKPRNAVARFPTNDTTIGGKVGEVITKARKSAL